jgi:hypothetical protein
MAPIIAGLIAALPSLLSSIQQLIARGRVTGELTAAEADALSAKAQMVFLQYAAPAPPPPNFNP